MTARDDDLLVRANWIILGLTLISVGLLAALAYQLLRPSDRPAADAGIRDPEVRREVIAQLVDEGTGLFDSHVDADVGRVHLPGLEDRRLGDLAISTNRFGMRERAYQLPKPRDVVRVVILGDSFVFGYGVAAEERLGAQLEGWLRERSPGFAGRVECLHLGVASWNVRAEAAYLRRQLYELEPDLVVHIIVPNDIDDTAAARGFGSQSSFSSQERARADARITAGYVRREWGFKKVGYLRFGLDWEARTRYAAMAEEIRRLAAAVEGTGAGYRLLVHFSKLLPVVREHLESRLDPGRIVYLSSRFSSDRSLQVSESDPHWNPEGHARVARLLYGLAAGDGLLPRLALPAWEEAARTFEEIAGAGRREAERQLSAADVLAFHPWAEIAADVDFTALTTASASQIHGGLDRQRRVSPYASFVLRNPGGSLRIQGRGLPHPELDGARVQVFVDAEPVGEVVLEPDREIDRRYRLPAAAAGRPYLSVRFAASDYVYARKDLQHCVVFQLDRIAIEP